MPAWHSKPSNNNPNMYLVYHFTYTTYIYQITTTVLYDVRQTQSHTLRILIYKNIRTYLINITEDGFITKLYICRRGSTIYRINIYILV